MSLTLFASTNFKHVFTLKLANVNVQVQTHFFKFNAELMQT